jgi:signal transduction histidine kinase
MTDHPSRFEGAWRYGQALLAPLAIWLVLGLALNGFDAGDRNDLAAVQEWLEEARNPDSTLPELSAAYIRAAEQLARVPVGESHFLERFEARQRVEVRRTEVEQHLRALGEPATKTYPGLLLLFPTVYRLRLSFHPAPWSSFEVEGLELGRPIEWDSGQLPGEGRARTAEFPMGDGATVRIDFQLHAWNKRQRDEQSRGRGLLLLVLLGGAASALGVAWMMAVHARERLTQEKRREEQEKLDRAERQLLEQRLATEEAQRQALELKSHLYASIGIMAGSYAHNIKNLLVRPNDLLRRCLEREGPDTEVAGMLREVRETLALVTDRLQQILTTVRRDPTRPDLKPVDLNEVLRELARTWGALAAERWQLDLTLDLCDGPFWAQGDLSHLVQAVENLLFNARDATFEMRGLLREEARQAPADRRRQALIAAAEWRGQVVICTRPGRILEVSDNGVGMTEEVRRRCTETHFSTKRDNALYEGHSTGMGLGLAFVASILEAHGARLEVDSAPRQGATFRAIFPEAHGG